MHSYSLAFVSSISTFLIVLILCLVPTPARSELIKDGVIYAGNYSLFSVTLPGLVVINLVSLSGDADIYVCQHPSVADAENYEISSCSCGEESVVIPHDFARPVSVAIYGHPAAAETHYKLFAEFVEVKVVDGFLTYLSHSASTEEAVLSTSSASGNLKSSKTAANEKSGGGGAGETFGVIVTILFEFLRIVADLLL